MTEHDAIIAIMVICGCIIGAAIGRVIIELQTTGARK